MSGKFGKYITEYEEVFFIEKNNTFDIYNAFNIKDNRDVTLKLMKKENYPDYDLLMKNLEHEKEILTQNKSENILNFYRSFETEKNVILEQEWYEMNMHEYIMNNGPSSDQKQFFKSIAIELGKALQGLYKNQVMHRNIKSSTVFLTKKKNGYSVKLGEFSKAIYFNENKSEPLSSYYYVAPEIINGENYDEKSDIWSFGITLYDLYFGDLPYGYKPSKNRIIKAISDEENFHLKKSGIPSLDELFKGTLKINPKERFNHEQVFKIIFSPEFMDLKKTDFLLIKKNSINDINEFITSDEVIDYIKEKSQSSSLLSSVKSDINAPKYNNIIYYDEGSVKRVSLNRDLAHFEEETQGTFIFCNNMETLEILKEEILKEIDLNPKTKFNLITSGSTFNKVINFISQNSQFEKCFKNYCIYCMNLKKYEHFKNEYKDKIHDYIYNNRDDIIEFIKKTTSSKIKPFHINKLITYNLYKLKYIEIQLDIESYQYKEEINEEECYDQIKDYINQMDSENQLKNEKDKLLKSLEIFANDNPELILKEFINVFYEDFNNILINNGLEISQCISFLTSKFNTCIKQLLNLKNYYYWNNNDKIYMGANLPLSELLQFVRDKDKIVTFFHFLIFYENKKLAEELSHREDSLNYYKSNLKFSVLFIINRTSKEDYIYYGVNIENYINDKGSDSFFSRFAKFFNKKEKAVLFMPFSFFDLKSIDIDFKNYTANIYLETR